MKNNEKLLLKKYILQKQQYQPLQHHLNLSNHRPTSTVPCLSPRHHSFIYKLSITYNVHVIYQ